MDIREFRKQYPQYDDMKDDELVGALHKKFYSDLDPAEFSKKIKYTSGYIQEDVQKLPLDETEKARRMHSEGDYDMDGYVKKYGQPDQSKGQHLTDEFKMPNHITFSNESAYSKPGQEGGKWEEQDGKWHFYPSEFNLQRHPPEELSQYFDKYEKDAVLHLPGKGDEQQRFKILDTGESQQIATDQDDRERPVPERSPEKYLTAEDPTAGPRMQSPPTSIGTPMDIARTAGRQGAIAASSFNKGMATMMQNIGGIFTGPNMDKADPKLKVAHEKMAATAQKVKNALGIPEEGLFKAWEKAYTENAKYWDSKIGESGLTDEIIGEFVGGAIPGMVEFALGPAYAAEVELGKSGSAIGAGEAALKRYLMGYILHAANTLKIAPRTVAMAGIGAAEAGMHGADAREMAKSAGVMAGFGLTAGNRGRSVRDAIRDFRETTKKGRAKQKASVELNRVMQDVFDRISEIDEMGAKANEAATSPQNNLPEPTEAQKAAGNYRKGDVKVNGLDITIENPAGSVRRGKDEDGNAWETEMVGHYGYFKRTEGKDGDQIDVFVAPRPVDVDKVFIVDQNNPKTGAFDEHKVVLGVENVEQAKQLYLSNYEPGWNGLGAITPVDMSTFKQWLKAGKHNKPVGPKELPPGQVVDQTPAQIEIPDFKNTNEARDFGKTATPEQIAALKQKFSENSARIEELKAAKDVGEERQNRVYNSQFMREAIETAEGRGDYIERNKDIGQKPVGKPKSKGTGPQTLRGRIKAAGGINFLNFKGELKNMPYEVKMLSNVKTGTPIDLIERTLKDEGWLSENESLLDILTQGKKVLKRGKVISSGTETRTAEQKEQDRKLERESVYEPEAPPPGDYTEMKAEDLPRGKKITIIDGNGKDGWDIYEVIDKDPFSVTLKDGNTIELGPLDRVQARVEDIKPAPDLSKAKQETAFDVEPELFEDASTQPKPKPAKKEKSKSDQEQKDMFGYNQTDMFGARTKAPTGSGEAEAGPHYFEPSGAPIDFRTMMGMVPASKRAEMAKYRLKFTALGIDALKSKADERGVFKTDGLKPNEIVNRIVERKFFPPKWQVDQQREVSEVSKEFSDIFQRKRGGGSSGGSEAEAGGYAERPRVNIDLPELVEIAKAAMGKIPKVVKNLQNKLGVFRHKDVGAEPGSADILLRSDLPIGERIAEASFKPDGKGIDKRFEKFKDDVRKQSGLADDKLSFKKEFNKKTRKIDFIAYRKDPTLAGKVLAHEIGHLADWIPDQSMKRGNILGRIASLKSYIEKYLAEYEGAPGQPLTKADRDRLAQEAERRMDEMKPDRLIMEEITKEVPVYEMSGISPEMILDIMRGRIAGSELPEIYRFMQTASSQVKKEVVKQAMKNIIDSRVPGWYKFEKVGTTELQDYITKIKKGHTKKETETLFKQFLEEEIRKRKLYERDVVIKELKDITQIWKPFNPEMNKKYTAYRHSGKELYADAISVLLNEPDLLKDKAPSFYKGFFNYLDKKPEFKKVYDEIQTRLATPGAVESQRLDDVYEMQKAGHEKRTELNKASIGKIEGAKDTAARWLIDKYHDVLKVVRKYEKSPDDRVRNQARKVRFDLEETSYIAAEVNQYLYDINKHVLAPLTDAKISIDDIGAYMFAKHVEANRAEIFSAKGHTKGTAGKLLTELEKRLGKDKFDEVQKVAEKYREIREKSIIPRIEESGIASPELIKIIKERKDYSKMSVQHYLEKKFGSGATSRFYKQIGSFADVENPFIPTVLQDISLLRAAQMNITKTGIVNLLSDAGFYTPAEMRYSKDLGGMKALEPKDGNQALFTIMVDGKPQHGYISKQIAETFKYSPFEANKIAEAWNLFNQPIRAILVSKNPLWMARNVIRDMRATMKNIPEATIRSIPELVKFYKQAYGEVWKDVFKGNRSKDLEEMSRGKMLVTDRVFGTKERTYDNEIARLADEFQINVNPFINKAASRTGRFKKAWETLDKLGRVSEVGGKLAGYKFLKAKGTRTPKEIAHIVRTRIGTPDYKRQGDKQNITNNIFLFSNVNKEGLRSAYESFMEDRSAYVWKTIAYNVLPKAMMMTAAKGLWGDEVKDIIDGFSEYEKSMYTVIPLGKTENGDSVGLRIPEDYEGQFWGALAWKLGNRDILGKDGTVALADQQIPYRLHPLIKVGFDLYDYYVRGLNPIDDYRGRTILSQRAFEIGGGVAAEELGKHTWNQIGPSWIYRFKSGELEKETTITKEALKTFPLSVLGSFVTVTNRGHAERYREISEMLDKERAQRSLDSLRMIERHINDNRSANNADKINLFREMVAAGVLPEGYTPRQFLSRYNTIRAHGKDDPRVVAISYAKSNKEKALLLSKFESELSEEKFNDLKGKLLQDALVTEDTIYEMSKIKKE